jgi:hypothetical protein
VVFYFVRERGCTLCLGLGNEQRVTQSVTGIILKEGHEFKKMKRKTAKKEF